jgi:hypothetical protein
VKKPKLVNRKSLIAEDSFYPFTIYRSPFTAFERFTIHDSRLFRYHHGQVESRKFFADAGMEASGAVVNSPSTCFSFPSAIKKKAH